MRPKKPVHPDSVTPLKAEGWNDQLHRTDRGEARDILHNAAIILRHDSRLKGRVRWNEMLQAVEGRDLPWSRGGPWREWTDPDDLQLADWCQERHAYLKPKTCAAAVQVVAMDQSVHPVRDRLESLKWDGTARLNGWLFRYLGVKVERQDSESKEEKKAAQARELYHRQVGRCWMVSAVARIFDPGCKVDTALILESPKQGKKKSTVAEALALEVEWFADSVADLGTKDSAQDLRGKWVIELGELSAMRRGEVERVKAYISRRRDHYRPSYGARSQDFPRQCVFIGSTNETEYLKDHTGNRRWWPVRVGTVDLEALLKDRDQLWAEAVAEYRARPRWWLDEEAEAAAEVEQADRRIDDPWDTAVMEWAERQAEPVTIPRALEHLGIPVERRDQVAQNRVAQIFRVANWERHRAREGNARFWAYRPGPTLQPEKADWSQSEAEVGPEKPNETKTGPSGPSGPSNSPYIHARRRDAAEVPLGQWDHWDQPTAWQDKQAWMERLKRTETVDEVRSVVFAWGKAAGGTVVDGTTPTVQLPKLLPECEALVSLRKMAQDIGVQVTS